MRESTRPRWPRLLEKASQSAPPTVSDVTNFTPVFVPKKHRFWEGNIQRILSCLPLYIFYAFIIAMRYCIEFHLSVVICGISVTRFLAKVSRSTSIEWCEFFHFFSLASPRRAAPRRAESITTFDYVIR